MFPPKKKSPAIGVMIGLGPKGSDDSSGGGGPSMPPKYKSPGSADSSMPSSAPSPPGSSGPPKPKAPATPTAPGMPSAAHEAAESPAEESGEEYGAKLLSDMTQPLIAAGMPEEHAKATLAGIFDAMAKCLRGEHDGGAMAGGMDMGAGDSGGSGGAEGY